MYQRSPTSAPIEDTTLAINRPRSYSTTDLTLSDRSEEAPHSPTKSPRDPKSTATQEREADGSPKMALPDSLHSVPTRALVSGMVDKIPGWLESLRKIPTASFDVVNESTTTSLIGRGQTMLILTFHDKNGIIEERAENIATYCTNDLLKNRQQKMIQQLLINGKLNESRCNKALIALACLLTIPASASVAHLAANCILLMQYGADSSAQWYQFSDQPWYVSTANIVAGGLTMLSLTPPLWNAARAEIIEPSDCSCAGVEDGFKSLAKLLLGGLVTFLGGASIAYCEQIFAKNIGADTRLSSTWSQLLESSVLLIYGRYLWQTLNNHSKGLVREYVDRWRDPSQIWADNQRDEKLQKPRQYLSMADRDEIKISDPEWNQLLNQLTRHITLTFKYGLSVVAKREVLARWNSLKRQIATDKILKWLELPSDQKQGMISDWEQLSAKKKATCVPMDWMPTQDPTILTWLALNFDILAYDFPKHRARTEWVMKTIVNPVLAGVSQVALLKMANEWLSDLTGNATLGIAGGLMGILIYGPPALRALNQFVERLLIPKRFNLNPMVLLASLGNGMAMYAMNLVMMPPHDQTNQVLLWSNRIAAPTIGAIMAAQSLATLDKPSSFDHLLSNSEQFIQGLNDLMEALKNVTPEHRPKLAATIKQLMELGQKNQAYAEITTALKLLCQPSAHPSRSSTPPSIGSVEASGTPASQSAHPTPGPTPSASPKMQKTTREVENKEIKASKDQGWCAWVYNNLFGCCRRQRSLAEFQEPADSDEPPSIGSRFESFNVEAGNNDGEPMSIPSGQLR